MFALPWLSTNIYLGKIAITNGGDNYWITGASNTLTDRYVWDYTGSGPHSGYEQLSSDPDVLQAGTGYWVRNLTGSTVTLLIPPDNSGGWFPATSSAGSGIIKADIAADGEEPPPPPGGMYPPDPSPKSEDSGGCFISTISGR